MSRESASSSVFAQVMRLLCEISCMAKCALALMRRFPLVTGVGDKVDGWSYSGESSTYNRLNKSGRRA
jgi:hypothetical protein